MSETIGNDRNSPAPPGTPGARGIMEMGLAGAALERIAAIRNMGVELDVFGQIAPRAGIAARSRIAADFLDVHHRIVAEIHRGRHVLYVPGSYDLAHVGHASYIAQGVEQYLNAHPNLTRDDLYVVVLCDDDELIRAVKPPHLYAAQGEHPRPIQCFELFEHLADIHPRLLDMASLPVDLVGFIPAPSGCGHLMNHDLFRRWLRACELIPTKEDASLEVSTAIRCYNRLIETLQSDRFVTVKTDFQRAKFGLSYDPRTAAWDVGSWQFLMHRFLGDVYRPQGDGHYIRLISDHDVKYKNVVAGIMQLCGIGHHFIDDLVVVSTTALVKTFGWEALVAEKLESHRRIRS